MNDLFRQHRVESPLGIWPSSGGRTANAGLSASKAFTQSLVRKKDKKLEDDGNASVLV